MRIEVQKNLVEFTPENPEETTKLEALWRLMVDCVRFNKKMTPVGAYIPADNNVARFAIEGEGGGSVDDYAEVYVDADCRCFCQTCNNTWSSRKATAFRPVVEN